MDAHNKDISTDICIDDGDHKNDIPEAEFCKQQPSENNSSSDNLKDESNGNALSNTVGANTYPNCVIAYPGQSLPRSETENFSNPYEIREDIDFSELDDIPPINEIPPALILIGALDERTILLATQKQSQIDMMKAYRKLFSVPNTKTQSAKGTGQNNKAISFNTELESAKPVRTPVFSPEVTDKCKILNKKVVHKTKDKSLKNVKEKANISYSAAELKPEILEKNFSNVLSVPSCSEQAEEHITQNTCTESDSEGNRKTVPVKVSVEKSQTGNKLVLQSAKELLEKEENTDLKASQTSVFIEETETTTTTDNGTINDSEKGLSQNLHELTKRNECEQLTTVREKRLKRLVAQCVNKEVCKPDNRDFDQTSKFETKTIKSRAFKQTPNQPTSKSAKTASSWLNKEHHLEDLNRCVNATKRITDNHSESQIKSATYRFGRFKQDKPIKVTVRGDLSETNVVKTTSGEKDLNSLLFKNEDSEGTVLEATGVTDINADTAETAKTEVNSKVSRIEQFETDGDESNLEDNFFDMPESLKIIRKIPRTIQSNKSKDKQFQTGSSMVIRKNKKDPCKKKRGNKNMHLNKTNTSVTCEDTCMNTQSQTVQQNESHGKNTTAVKAVERNRNIHKMKEKETKTNKKVHSSIHMDAGQLFKAFRQLKIAQATEKVTCTGDEFYTYLIELFCNPNLNYNLSRI